MICPIGTGSQKVLLEIHVKLGETVKGVIFLIDLQWKVKLLKLTSE